MAEVKEKEVGISSPWMTYYKKLVALFGDDPELEVSWKEEGAEKSVIIASTNTFKIMALEKLLDPKITFGNITLTVKCLVKDGSEDSASAIFRTAFAGNPHISEVIDQKTMGCIEQTFVLFKPEVIQFFNDDITDYYGNWNGLAEDLMRDVIKQEFVNVNIGTSRISQGFKVEAFSE